ncbi:MAG: thermonuclease family protein [Myxococcales bacterium]|nr:thermonuclease family protein [Myxococcales bacterium]
MPRTLTRSLVVAAAVASLAGLSLVACGPPEGAARYGRKQAQTTLSKLEAPGVVIGEFGLTKIIDGDTVGVDGLDSSLRLLGIDTEETYKNQADRLASDADFVKYLADKRAGHSRPVKAATPLGEDAKTWAKHFFAGVDKVRLERDNPRQIRGRYNRYLAYVFAFKNGQWVNYNVEAVRAGMSPYFTKYGYSRRFHQEFVDAEREAKAAHLGIWDPTKLHYPDYAERKPWWTARAEFVAEFERQAEGRDDYIDLTDFDSLRRIEAAVGKEVTVMSTVGEVRLGDRGPTKVMLSRRMFGDFPLVFFDKDVFASTGIARWKGEFVMVRGVVAVYENKHNGKKQLQIIVDRPGQVTLSPLPGLVRPGDEPAPESTSTAAQ